MAMGLQRAHAELLGQSKGLPIMGFIVVCLWGLAPRRDLAEEAQDIRLVAPVRELAGDRQGALGVGVRLRQATRQHLRLP